MMTENIKEIEQSMTNIDYYLKRLKSKSRVDDNIALLTIEIENLDLMLDKVFKPMNYERRIKENV